MENVPVSRLIGTGQRDRFLKGGVDFPHGGVKKQTPKA